ncbi:hypothetical protein ILYODFUR_022169 [Ilyodon furcidens]|uniref:Uncharacterized protein n=1 Tax=Ilyodon furcidens TaxID=33524 RepID=A0ABV0U974_9TELE
MSPCYTPRGRWSPNLCGGREILAVNSRTHIYTQRGFWNPAPWLDSLLLWICPQGEVAGWVACCPPKAACCTQLGCHMLGFTPEDEWVTSLRLQVRDKSLTVVSA